LEVDETDERKRERERERERERRCLRKGRRVALFE